MAEHLTYIGQVYCQPSNLRACNNSLYVYETATMYCTLWTDKRSFHCKQYILHYFISLTGCWYKFIELQCYCYRIEIFIQIKPLNLKGHSEIRVTRLGLNSLRCYCLLSIEDKRALICLGKLTAHNSKSVLFDSKLIHPLLIKRNPWTTPNRETRECTFAIWKLILIYQMKAWF